MARHMDVLVGALSLGARAAQMPDPTSLRIVKDGAGCSLLRLDKSGITITHTWHASVEDAQARAATDYGVAADEWERD